jgi:hypothetical protein
MPLKTGKSQKTVSSNISELHKGKTFAETSKKFGKNKANKQSIAIALSEAKPKSTSKFEKARKSYYGLK